MIRIQRILTAVLGLQILLIAVIFWPRGGEVRTGKPLLTNFDSTQITRISIDDGDGNSITLEKSSGVWVLPNSDDYPADSQKIETMLKNLQAIQTNRLVTQTTASHKRLGVAQEDFERRIRLESTNGTTATVFVGSSSGPRATHVRLEGQDEVFLTGEVNNFDIGADPSSWIDTTYLEIPSDQVTSMELENANGVLEFEREGTNGEWSLKDIPEDRLTNSSAITTIVNRITTLRMVQPVSREEKPEFGFDSPNAVITLAATGENESTRNYTIEIGAKVAGGDDYYVRSSESDYIVQIAGFSVDDLVNNSQTDFLQENPTPTPES